MLGLLDAVGRVTSADRNVPQEAVPNSVGTVTNTFDAANQVAGATYDSAGRLTAGDGGTSTYTWNPASRLMSYARADGSTAFTYDALGGRTGRGATRYTINYALALPSVATVGNASGDVRYYVHTPGGRLLYSIEASDGSHKFYSFDDIGSTTFLSDDTGSITDAYGIAPYGETVTPSANNTSDNPFTWQGQLGVMQELGTSLYYMRARYYDSAAERFLSRDPLWVASPRQVNRYQYAAGDPVAFRDPTGLTTAQVVWSDGYVDRSSGLINVNSRGLLGIAAIPGFQGYLLLRRVELNSLVIPDIPEFHLPGALPASPLGIVNGNH